MTIYLYIKTYRVTGLKYFGKTTRDNPYRYKGSGTYWKRHIKQHGYDCDTEIVGIFNNINDAETFALKFSRENNIVESNEWANLIEENGMDGPPLGTNKGIKRPYLSERNKNVIYTEELRQKMSRGKGRVISEEWRKKISIANKGRKHKPHSEETKEKISKSRLGNPLSEETKEKIRIANLGKKYGPRGPHSKEHREKIRKGNEKKWEITCPNGQVINITNLYQFCLKNELNAGLMSSVASGRRIHHKGWKCKKLEE